MKKTFLRMLSLGLILVSITLLVLPCLTFPTKALSYSGSSSYSSGKYYSNLVGITLTGDNRTDIVNIAKSQIGYQEGGSSSQLSGTVKGSGNYTEYGRWYGMQDMWCAMFVSWCANVAGIPTSVVPSHSYTPTGLNWFLNRGQAYSRSTVANGGYTPQPGDIIYFKSSRNQNITNHVGIVTSYSNGTVYTIEGNTSSATISTNGGAVCAKSYSISNTYIRYICSPSYSAPVPVPQDLRKSVVFNAEYNAIAYANNILKKSQNPQMKALVVAMLNYGAAAQVYFNYNTDNLMNAGLTAEQQALVQPYSSSMADVKETVDSSKIGNFAKTSGGFTRAEATVIFEGALSTNFYLTTSAMADGEDGNYYFYLDAIRIYDPADDGASDGAIDVTIENAYRDDHEAWPSYIELRNNLINSGTFYKGNDSKGIVYIDGRPEVGKAHISDYEKYGPNNEVYLANGQSIAFMLSCPANIDQIHIGIKSANGSNCSYTIANVGAGGTAVKTATLSTATDMYYDITDLRSGIIVITNTGDGLISLTNIKSTYTSNPGASRSASGGMEVNETYVYMNQEAASLVLDYLNTPVDGDVPEGGENIETQPDAPEIPGQTEPGIPETGDEMGQSLSGMTVAMLAAVVAMVVVACCGNRGFVAGRKERT